MRKPGPFLRDNYSKTYFLFIAVINFIKKIKFPYSIYITDSLGGSFKSYFIKSDMSVKVSELKKNLDDESILTIDVIMQRLLNYPDEKYKSRTKKHQPVIGGLLPSETSSIKKITHSKLKSGKQRLSFLSKNMEESVFYYYHGLSLLPEQVANYIKDQDFVDIGAFLGDSAIALMNYQYRKIYSMEISRKSIEKYKINVQKAKLNEDKIQILNICIGSTSSDIPVRLFDTGSSGLSILRKSGKYDEILVPQKSFDQIVKEEHIAPRFIKVDIEGNGLEFVKGARETLIKFRPVLSIAIYHNPNEFFEIKPLLEGLLNNYTFLIRKLSSEVKYNSCHSEVILLGYPKEVFN